VSGRDFGQGWAFVGAAGHGPVAAGMKHAAGRGSGRIGRFAGQGRPVPLAGIESWHGREQRPGIRMARPGVKGAGRGQFHDLPEVHHRHPVA